MSFIRFTDFKEFKDILSKNDYKDLFVELFMYVDGIDIVGVTPDNKSAVTHRDDVLYLFSKSTDEDSIKLMVHYVENLFKSRNIKQIEMNSEAIHIVNIVNANMGKGHDSFTKCFILKRTFANDYNNNNICRFTNAHIDDMIKFLVDEGKIVTTKYVSNTIENFINNYKFYGLKIDDTIVSKLYVMEYGKDAFIGGVYTLSEHRGKGYATSLLNTVCNTLLKGGYNKILLATEEDNKLALDIYESNGFTKYLDYLVYYCDK